MIDVWSERAEAYREAAEHREGEDLERLASWVAPGMTVLDVAAGGGHTARRLREAGCSAVTADASPGMRPDVICPAEELPFADGSFDAVVTRIAAHHFPDVRAAVAEMARVSRGLVLVEDTLFADERVEEAERLRDPTHVRSLSEEEWRGVLEGAGLEVEEVVVFEKRRPLETWLARTGCEGNEAERVKALLAPSIRGGDYVDRKIVLRARKRA